MTEKFKRRDVVKAVAAAGGLLDVGGLAGAAEPDKRIKWPGEWLYACGSIHAAVCGRDVGLAGYLVAQRGRRCWSVGSCQPRAAQPLSINPSAPEPFQRRLRF